MSLNSTLAALLAAFLLVFAAAPASALDGDAPGSSDIEGIGRFAGSVISGYEAKDFDAARFQAAPLKDGQPVDPRTIEGKVTRIAYRTGPGPSMLEVMRNYENRLKEQGFETVLSCESEACGGLPFPEHVDVLPLPQMWADGFNFRYFAGKKVSGGTESWASVLVSQNNDEIYAQLVVAVSGAMENRMVDAEKMAKGLGEAGHIALYGIYFDTDKATLKPESKPTLDEIAKLLSGAPELKVIIVGHTDSQGAYDYNMDLSRRRAEAVAAELVRSYAVDKGRLRTAGVGFLAPVASNAGEDGRALNRRVELVAP